jgi:hypothetical protein
MNMLAHNFPYGIRSELYGVHEQENSSEISSLQARC